MSPASEVAYWHDMATVIIRLRGKSGKTWVRVKEGEWVLRKRTTDSREVSKWVPNINKRNQDRWRIEIQRQTDAEVRAESDRVNENYWKGKSKQDKKELKPA